MMKLRSAVTVTMAFALASLVLAAGCDYMRASRHPHGAAASEDGGETDGGVSAPHPTAPGPTFTAQPGDIQI
jgi:hypothetical protein